MATASREPTTRPRRDPVVRPDQTTPTAPSFPLRAGFFVVVGLYLTLRGYHSFDGDQAYRLPLLIHQLDPATFATDSFVRAFDQFNPHRGYLALLNLASRPFGIASALLGLFAITLALTIRGIDRLTRSVWPEQGGQVGLAAVILVLLAKAGNIGTNHLFESTLLDRLIGFALGWLAIAWAVDSSPRGWAKGAVALGLATLVHPSVGLQLALTLATAWVAWSLASLKTGVSPPAMIRAVLALAVALVPGVWLMLGQSGQLLKGLPVEEFRLLAVQIQGPQHMLPSTWRTPQWLAWACYPILAILALGSASRPWPVARVRLAWLIGVNLASLALAELAVEVVGDLRVTIFQPFRMATLARGLALVAVAGRVVTLWGRRDLTSRGRAVLIGVGLGGDWMLVVATVVDLTLAMADHAGWSARAVRRLGLTVLGLGLVFLARRDTESGHLGLIAGLVGLALFQVLNGRRAIAWPARRVALVVGLSWAVPAASLVVGMVMRDPGARGWSSALVERCRFAEVPVDDLERLAVWARENTPTSSRFIGPPGPKTFRLWSGRALGFSRAGSPYHAEGLADWSSRFRDHVGFTGESAEFARAYLADRHGLEAGYGRMTDRELARLARSQGADHVLTAAHRPVPDLDSPLIRLRVEGRYAVSRVKPDR